MKPNVEAALQNYNDFLQENNDVDDIEELVDLLNFECEDDVPEVLFVASHSERADPNEWISAMADFDPAEGKTITFVLHAKNLEGSYGPQTFIDTLFGALGHETIHWNQYDKFDPKKIDSHKSGHMKGTELIAKGGTQRDWMRSYLRDPHELMAYGHDLANDMMDSSDPQQALRNPEMFKEELPTWQRFRQIFPKDAKQMKQLLKYATDYFN